MLLASPFERSQEHTQALESESSSHPRRSFVDIHPTQLAYEPPELESIERLSQPAVESARSPSSRSSARSLAGPRKRPGFPSHRPSLDRATPKPRGPLQ